MATPNSVKSKIQGLIDVANATTAKSDDNLTDGVYSLIAGYGQGGASECSGNHIIEVDELPTENIDEGAIYSASVKFSEVYLMIAGGAMAGTLTELMGEEGTINYYTVDELPEEITDDIAKSDMDNGILNCYYVETGNETYPSDIYACMLDADTSSYEWVTLATMFAFFEITYKGVIGSTSEVAGDGYYVLSGSGYFKYYEASFDDCIYGGQSMKADTRGLYYAETEPSNPEISDVANLVVYLYYIADPSINDIVLYDGTQRVSLSTMGYSYTFGGAIEDVSLATDSTKYYAVITPAGFQKMIPEKDAGSPPPSVEENKTVTPTTYSQEVTPSSGYDFLEKVTVNPIPSSYAYVSGTKNITSNGTHDVKNYLSAKVNVPIPDGYIVPANDLEITKNGEYNVKNYASATVNVPNTLNGVIREYEVKAGATVNAGDFVEFVNKLGTGSFDGANSMTTCKIDDTRVLVAYGRSYSTDYGKAFVLTLSDGTIRKGSEVTFNTGWVNGVSAVTLTESSVLLAYSAQNNTDYGSAVVLTIDGSNITVGTSVFFEKTCSGDISACKLDNNRVLIAYRKGLYSKYGTAVVLTIDGSNITVGTPVEFDSNKTTDFSAVALTETTILVTYVDEGNSSYGTAIVLTVNDSTITTGTKTVFQSTTTYETNACKLDESRAFVFCWAASSGLALAYATVLTVSDGAISIGTKTTFRSDGYHSATMVTENMVLVAYTVGAVRYVANVDTDVTPLKFRHLTVRNESTCTESVAAFSSSAAVLVHSKDGNSFTSSGYTGVLFRDTGSMYLDVVQKATSNLVAVGVAKTGGTDGEMVEVYRAV